jgi:hypothetical protein
MYRRDEELATAMKRGLVTGWIRLSDTTRRTSEIVDMQVRQ